ncbi:zinc transport system permease protein [Acholeplasma morum]|uniref:metal ABC transporter permease n=1 Tax=Paracholeplasma morum TaxID=264637 RepID=UPI00195AB5A9|nr:metal ABC transporter permease [Paracholeplasma morum]MBM7453506.1 zinc transport system permease protein [Paracholeplasma morum]
MFEFLLWPFVIRALIIGIILALSTAMISNFLVSNNQSLIGDGLAHISFTGIIIGVLLSSEPTVFALPFAILSAILIKTLMRNKLIEGDTAIGLVSSSAFAVGLILISKSDGFNRSVESMLVGSMFSTTWTDIILALAVLVLVIGFIVKSYSKLISITLDDQYAKFTGIKIAIYDYALAILTATVIVIGVKTIGTLLISAFIIFPAVSSNMLAKSFKQMFLYSIIINITITVLGIIGSYFLEFPAGSTIIVFHAILFLILYVFTKLKGRE